ncbi:MAG: hypothetical protein ABI647_03010 [Gemmatimonadota bacterium]
MTDDRFDEFLDQAAKEYNPPPEPPREAMWQAIQARRSAASPRVVDIREAPSIRLGRPWLAIGMGIAAILALGIGIGRWSGLQTKAVTPPVTVAGTDRTSERSQLAMQLVATMHLSRIDNLLTDLSTQKADSEFIHTTRDLLSDTRLLLDSPRLTDPKLKRLLEDLETILVQIAQLKPHAGAEDRELINDGMAHKEIRSRLRNAIPAGPTA